MSLTVQQAAAAGRCSASFIRQLAAAGKINAVNDAGEKGKRARWRILASRSEVRSYIHNHTKAGWKKSSNGGQTTSRRSSTLSAALRGLSQWAAIPDGKRGTLIKLAAKFSADDLRLLLEL